MNRLACETHEIEAAPDFRVAVGLCLDAQGNAVEVVLNRIDKARDDMADTILSNCAIALSHLLQGRPA